MDPTFELILEGAEQAGHFYASLRKLSDPPLDPLEKQLFRLDSWTASQHQELEKFTKSGRRSPEADAHTRELGQQLYKAVFTGAIAEAWNDASRAQKNNRAPLHLIVRPDPRSALTLFGVPWEYLHDGTDFLAKGWRTPISRLPLGIEMLHNQPLDEPLRILIMVSDPDGLSQEQKLNTAREEYLIQGALADAHRAAKLEIEFTSSGSLEALENSLTIFDPHVLHFIGHGSLNEETGVVELLVEDRYGAARRVSSEEFAARLTRMGRSLRLVFFSSCQTALGRADIASALLRQNIPAVVVMQFNILNDSSMNFAAKFYEEIASDRPLDLAANSARAHLSSDSANGVDFATPVLYLADPDCLRAGTQKTYTGKIAGPTDQLAGLDITEPFIGRNTELRAIQERLLGRIASPTGGRAVVLYGLGGVGKTAIVSRMVERLRPLAEPEKRHFDSILYIDLSPNSSAETVLAAIAGHLRANAGHFNDANVAAFLAVRDDSASSLNDGINSLLRVLRSLQLLLIFNNCEYMLPGRNDILAQGATPNSEWRDEMSLNEKGVEFSPGELEAIQNETRRVISSLVAGTPGLSRFLFISRTDFDPVAGLDSSTIPNYIQHIQVGELQPRDAIYFMQTFESLKRLPVFPLTPVPGERPQFRPLGLWDVYKQLGGHPWTLARFAGRAEIDGADVVLNNLDVIHEEAFSMTRIASLVAKLPNRARLLLRRAAVFDERPVPWQALSYVLARGKRMRPESETIMNLVKSGLLTSSVLRNVKVYIVPAIVRAWERKQFDSASKSILYDWAARYWNTEARESQKPEDFVEAARYFNHAGSREDAYSAYLCAYAIYKKQQESKAMAEIEELIGMMQPQLSQFYRSEHKHEDEVFLLIRTAKLIYREETDKHRVVLSQLEELQRLMESSDYVEACNRAHANLEYMSHLGGSNDANSPR